MLWFFHYFIMHRLTFFSYLQKIPNSWYLPLRKCHSYIIYIDSVLISVHPTECGHFLNEDPSISDSFFMGLNKFPLLLSYDCRNFVCSLISRQWMFSCDGQTKILSRKLRFGLIDSPVNPHPIIQDLYIYLRNKLLSCDSLVLCSNTELHLVRLSWKALNWGGG